MPLLLNRLAVIAALLLAFAPRTFADDYPNRPVRLIIPFPPGGSNDVVGRLVAQQLTAKLGQQVYVDNRGGAGGTIGTEACATAAPDGYTICVISIAHAVNPALYTLKYDPIKSFTPISIFATGPNVLVVNPTSPIKSVKDLLALAKEKPGELNYASAGVGSFQHLGAELFKLQAKVNLVHVPYKGGGPAMQDVIAGHVKIMTNAFAAAGIVAVVSGLVGYFLVMRGQTFAGHALSHIGFAGATGAGLIGLAPLWGLLAFTLAAGIVMGALSERISNRDVAIGVVLALALGFGLLFLHYYTSFATQATALLFGNVLAVDHAMNGSGSETVARSQTMRGGIIGTSQMISR